MTDSYTFLHLTDIHSAFDNILKVKAYLQENPKKIDFILSSGDLTNMIPADNEDPEKVKKNEEEVVEVLKALLSVHPLVYFIPGNHDASSYFDGTGKSIPSAINLHKKHLRICDDLVISSFGGSVPAFQGGKQRWIGYPYEKPEDIESELREFLQHDLASDNSGDAPSEGDSVLLMTHVGPGKSSTAIEQIDLENPEITAGCFILDSILREPEQQKRVFMNIHGHTHFAEGVSKIGNTFIFNPGSLKFDSFGIVTIQRKNAKWQYKSMEMIQF